MPVHHLMVGTWTPPGAIFTVAFDDAACELRLVHRTAAPADEPISWMAFDHAKRNLYGAAVKHWSSFAVASPTRIVHQASFPLLHDARAQAPAADTRAIFLLAARQPHGVYCNPFYSRAGRGSVFAVSPAGALAAHVQAFDYQPGSGVHGTVFDPPGRVLYSADLAANRVWAHRRPDPASPRVELVGAVDCPDPRDRPRWVAMHPSGRRLYVLMEAGNRVCECALDPDAAAPLPRFTGRHGLLVPDGEPDRWSRFRGDVCALSRSADYLFASTRASDPARPGFLSVFKLSPAGDLERRVLVEPTRTSGGHSNAVTPSDWSDDWVALVEDTEGWLDVYRWQDEALTRAASLRIPEPGFGMNAIWYD